MNQILSDEIAAAKNKYQEAFVYLGEDRLLINPERAYNLFLELYTDGFIAAGFYVGLMACLGLGVPKEIERGKKWLKDAEQVLGYETEVVIEQAGLFKELTLEEKLKCINYWRNNHQTTHAMFLQAHI